MRTVEARRAEFRKQLKKKRVMFEQHVIAQHRRVRTGLLRFLKSSPLVVVLTAPVVYTLVLPLAVRDLGVCLFQLVCFPIWGISRVRRSDYVVIDREHLAYLNAVQKVNCVYGGYATGFIAFMQEVAGRTEQYWCPIKHARRVKAPHQRYRQFLD